MPYQSPWNEETETAQMPYNPNWQESIQYGQQPGMQTQPAPIPQYQPNQGSGMYEQGGFAGPQTGQVQPQQTPQYQAPQFSAGMSPEQVRSSVEQYYAGRGVTPYPTSVDYWTQKWGEFGQRDPEYFARRLAMADEFGGGGMTGAGGGAYVPGQGVPGFGTALGGAWGGRANSLYDLLMQRAGQSLMVDRTDPVIRNLADTYSAAATRGMRNYLGDVAERVGPNANIGAERRSAAERVAQGTAGYEAQLMGQEREARRQEIAQALAQALGLTTGQQQMSLQEALAQMGLAQQAYQYDQSQQYAYSPFGQGY